MLPKAQEANQSHNNQNSNSAVQQHLFGEQLKSQVQREQRTVVDARKSENPNVDKDGSNKNGGGEGKKRRKPKEAEAVRRAQELNEDRSMIDISV
jgi:hypothetical protein